MRRKRRELLKYGPSYEALMKELKTGQIKKIERKCRDLIAEFSVFNSGATATTKIIPFEMFGYGFLLDFDPADEIWVLNVVKRPLRKGPRGKKAPTAGKAPPPHAEAQPERVRRGPKKVYKREKAQKRQWTDLYERVRAGAGALQALLLANLYERGG